MIVFATPAAAPPPPLAASISGYTVAYAWTASYSTPATPSGLVITEDDELISLDAVLTASTNPYHYEYLWEAQAGDGDWTEIDRTTTAVLTYYLAPMNQDVRIRVSDSNGAIYSDTLEGVGSLTFMRWALTTTTGNEDLIQELRYVRPQETTDLPLDQVVLQPLSGGDGDTQLPIVFTGQWLGERIGFTVQIRPDDRFLIDVFRAAAREPAGTIALKDPKGSVYLVQLGGFSITDLGAGQQAIGFSAIRVA
jgi:hypothetical protein